MRSALLGRLLVASAALSIAACSGGGGGGSSGLGSTPPPPPPPPPPTFVKVFPDITTSTNFAVLGLEASAPGIAANQLQGSGFSVRYDAGQQAYLIDLPSALEGAFVSTSEDSDFWFGNIQGIGHYTNVSKPTSTNSQIALTYTSYGASSEVTCPFGCYSSAHLSFFAFGSPTPGPGVPTVGTASFDAIVAGVTLDDWSAITGDATLMFDFGAGTLAGHFDPVLHPNAGGGPFALGPYTFVNTVFGVGSTTFSGAFSHANPLLTGAFNGLFTGPSAQELMARWTAGYVNPLTQQNGEMFGIWAGKKDGGP